MEIEFEELKKYILNYYKELEYDNVVIDREDMWMLKSSKIKNSYIQISKNNEISFYNVDKPNDINKFDNIVIKDDDSQKSKITHEEVKKTSDNNISNIMLGLGIIFFSTVIWSTFIKDNTNSLFKKDSSQSTNSNVSKQYMTTIEAENRYAFGETLRCISLKKDTYHSVNKSNTFPIRMDNGIYAYSSFDGSIVVDSSKCLN